MNFHGGALNTPNSPSMMIVKEAHSSGREMNRMNEEVSKEKIVNDFKTLIHDAEELLRATANQAGETVSAARQQIERSLEQGKHTLAEAEDILLDKTREAARLADDYVRGNPWSAVGIAAGIGLVLGLLMRRD